MRDLSFEIQAHNPYVDARAGVIDDPGALIAVERR